MGAKKKPGAVATAERVNQLTPNQPLFLDTLAYPCEDETDNPVYRLFLR